MNWENQDYVMDARDDRYFGPYKAGDGKVAADQMNKFVHANSSLAWLGGTVVGPFFPVSWRAVPENWRRELKRLYEA